MKRSTRLILSLMAACLALYLYASPMWWGTLFPSLTRSLSDSPSATEVSEASPLRLHYNGAELRFRSLDLLLTFLREHT